MDSWTKPLKLNNGRLIYGGAARNKRIKHAGGMDNIIADISRYVLEQVDADVRRTSEADTIFVPPKEKSVNKITSEHPHYH